MTDSKTTDLKTTALNGFHTQQSGQMVEYAGWSMPIKFAGIAEEHRQVRASGGIFDVSHMGRLHLKGLHARRTLERACTRRIRPMQEGQCRYTLVTNENGGVIDDVIVMKHDDDEFTVVCNAANRERVVAHLQGIIDDRAFKAKLDDRTMKTAMVAVQGPKVMDLISRVSSEVPTLKRYRFTVKNLLVAKLVVSRTGYTGEDGVEVILPNSAVPMVMKLLMKEVDPDDPNAVVKPIGLGARDTLRLEAGMPLYGHELRDDWSALSSGLDFAMNLDKSEGEDGEMFIGQEALLRERDGGGPARKLVGLKLEGRRTARQGMPVVADGRAVGEVTSGCVGPTLECSIAMAMVDSSFASGGTQLSINLGKTEASAEVTSLQFYKKP
ncbi:MAG: glycine cleavage system aminomethyltransferase GcvT [Planctomycetota bacterium]